MYRPALRRSERHRARPAPAARQVPVIAGNVVLRRATAADLDATAQLHIEQLPVGFFPDLGPRFMRRWHRTFLDSPNAVAFVAVCRDGAREDVCAFLLGSTDEAAHMRALLADRRCLLTLASTAALSLLRHPPLAVRFLRTRAGPWTGRFLRTMTTRTVAHSAQVEPMPVALLAAVAVRPALRGSGVGALLVELFLGHAYERRAATAELLTSAGPDGAGAFYEHLGWSPGREHRTRDGFTVRSYHHPVVPPGRSGIFFDGRGTDSR